MSSGDENFFAGFMDDYFAECDEHLASIREQLLRLERGGEGAAADRDTLDELFRNFHSIKGISGMVDLREAELLAHQLETYLRAVRDSGAFGADGLDSLFDGITLLERTIAARREGTPPPSLDAIVRRLATAAAGIGSPSPAAPVQTSGDHGAANWRVVFAPTPDGAARGMNVDSVRSRLRSAATIVHAVPRVLPEGIAFEFTLAGDLSEPLIAEWRADGLTVEPVVPEPAAAEPEAEAELARGLQPSHVVRVDLTKLDDLMRIIGDLVISRARLEESLARVARHVPPVEWRHVQEGTASIERQLRELREGIVRVRLVPVGEIFRRMPFTVRDLAREQGKKVHLAMDGANTEIDKYLVERMLDPLVHLVRNAVSHGIELPDRRVAAGKPAEGTLRLSAAGVGDAVLIEIADDGAGIDGAAVAERARAAGLPVPSGPLDDKALLDLICTPGFSTREVADRASGRGVGMSVVKSTVAELNGTIALHTTPGQGTRYVIELPLTLSIADALIATMGERTFAVPQVAVREVVEVDAASLRPLGGQEVAPFRDGALPIVRVSRLFGLPDSDRPRLHVFVIGSGDSAVGLAVDRITGQREIVVRTMADTLVRVEGISGATDLGDGRVVLILDPLALARRGRRLEHGVPA